MSLNIECEVRTMLTKEQYDSLMSFYKDGEIIVQVNHYIDTEDFNLRNANRVSLRIRDIEGSKSELTLKIKGNNGDKEYNEYLTPEVRDEILNNNNFPDGEIKDILKSLGTNVSKLKYLTSLKTWRKEVNQNDALIVIDKNEYNGIIDYNLEIEAPTMEIAASEMKKLLNQFNLTLTKNYNTKVKRALMTRKK